MHEKLSHIEEAPIWWHLHNEQLGEGGFGAAKKVDVGGIEYIWKVFKADLVAANPDAALNEINALENIRDNTSTVHIVKYYEAKKRGENLCLRFELCSGGSLRRSLRQLSPEQAQRFSLHLFIGVAALHGIDLIHRDLKPDNLVLSGHDLDAADLKIIDFGFARLQEGTRCYTLCGSERYQDPMMNRMPSTQYPPKAADLYAIGMMLKEDLFKMENIGPVSDKLRKAVDVAVGNLLTEDVKERWTIEDLMASDLTKMCEEQTERMESTTTEVCHPGTFVMMENAAAFSAVSVSCHINALAVADGHGLKLVDLSDGVPVFAVRASSAVRCVAVLSSKEVIFADRVGVWYACADSEQRARPLQLVERVEGVTHISTTDGGRWVAYTTPVETRIAKVHRDGKGIFLTHFTFVNGVSPCIVENSEKGLVKGFIDSIGELDVSTHKATAKLAQGNQALKTAFQRQIYEALVRRNLREVSVKGDLKRYRQWPRDTVARGIPSNATLILSCSGRHVAIYDPKQEKVRVIKYSRESNSLDSILEVPRVSSITSMSFSSGASGLETSCEGYFMVTCKNWMMSYYAYVYSLKEGAGKTYVKRIQLSSSKDVAFFAPPGDGSNKDDQPPVVTVLEMDKKGMNLVSGGEKIPNILQDKLNIVPEHRDSGLSAEKYGCMQWVSGELVCNGSASYPAVLGNTGYELLVVPCDPTKPRICLHHKDFTWKCSGLSATLYHGHNMKMTSVFKVSDTDADLASLLEFEDTAVSSKDKEIEAGLSAALLNPSLAHLRPMLDLLQVEAGSYPSRV
eukprot:TRINITY_DN16884_c0_g1_i1.p1 TRINITY_DN16884_c0_g1~~TRINITY_DN16884_c0_g1_i1.p1  ORF type:complete len:812 (+),score=192.23 TRINITY_DN16884_c0_g1_i1:53-2437(+)